MTFAIPKLTPKDIENLEVSSLHRVAKVAEELNLKNSELNLKNSELNIKASEITRLEQQRNEMEFLVRKASYSLFLKDQIERNDNRVMELISKNKEVMGLLEEIKSNHLKLQALDDEIQSNENVELLLDIIHRVKRDEDAVWFMGTEIHSPFLKSYIKTVKSIIRL